MCILCLETLVRGLHLNCCSLIQQESVVDYTPASLPFNQGRFGGISPCSKRDNAFGSQDALNGKGRSWQNEIFLEQGKVITEQPSSILASGMKLCEQQVFRSDTDSMSVDSSASAVMPSAQELSFLLDCDDKQLSRNACTGHGGSLENNMVRANNHSTSSYSGRNDFNVTSDSLQVIANTLPSACDLTTDLSVCDNSCIPTSFSSRESVAPTSTTATSSEQRSFPWKLHEMLNDVETNGFQDIISWEPGGMAFKVHDCRLFVEKVMPLYFDQVSTRLKTFESCDEFISHVVFVLFL